MARLLLLLSLFALGCDGGGTACTEIGCTNSLIVTIADADDNPVDGMAGTITLGGHTFVVDCEDPAGNDAQVTCDGGVITLTLLHVDIETVLSADLSNADGDTCTESNVHPEWTQSQPNGADCPPVCSSSEVTMSVD